MVIVIPSFYFYMVATTKFSTSTSTSTTVGSMYVASASTYL